MAVGGDAKTALRVQVTLDTTLCQRGADTSEGVISRQLESITGLDDVVNGPHLPCDRANGWVMTGGQNQSMAMKSMRSAFVQAAVDSLSQSVDGFRRRQVFEARIRCEQQAGCPANESIEQMGLALEGLPRRGDGHLRESKKGTSVSTTTLATSSKNRDRRRGETLATPQ